MKHIPGPCSWFPVWLGRPQSRADHNRPTRLARTIGLVDLAAGPVTGRAYLVHKSGAWHESGRLLQRLKASAKAAV